MKTSEYFNEHGWFKEEYLWPLRQQITLGSLYISDYENSFGIDTKAVCEFFTSFWDSYCEERAEEDGLMEQAERIFAAQDKSIPSVEDIYLKLSSERYDNEETLKEWYGCFEGECPLPPKKFNVDIHWDFARSIQVIAADEDEAWELVNEMMKNGEIPKESFEAMEDWELDTTYQPE